MNKTRLFQKTLLAVAVSVTAQQSFAAGFQLNAQSATGLGRAFAGDAVIADNASVIAKNPAAMSLFDDVSLSLGFETITTLIDVKDATYTNKLAAQSENADYSGAGDTSVAPNFYLVVPVNEKFAWGINAYSNFGTKTEFNDNYTGHEFGGSTDVKSFNFGVVGSYRINQEWSLGAGLDLIYGKGKFRRPLNSTEASLLGTNVGTDLNADGWALGYNLGTVYEYNENNRFGLDYHYSPDINADGDVSYAKYSAASGSISDTVVMPLPDFAEFSGYHRLNDSYAIHYSIQWIKWSEFDVLAADTSGIINEYQWKDGWHYSLGGTYFLNPTWTLRAGYMYDTSAQDNTRSISVPDSDRQWLSAGVTYHLDEKSNVDFGFTYLIGKDVSVSESTTVSGTEAATIQGTTHADAVLMALQYSRSF
ncbi:outer membrane protein transport protein [Vibrio mangrovi]|uniref:Long-chain fatty acid transport protein n=1 Tax=Vibrio mangrovi TaxID=474394 RepID=A0A1Y6IUJ2_9VIBR|nr:outer membrane protein transport protein [Vibrio mangrovi]MDW6003495.1 outer membrane protein transport protein [Vibrio mangrovi]SMR99713.1 Long-chain fatty acid transport protein precursor [Vibrio mangrovi]